MTQALMFTWLLTFLLFHVGRQDTVQDDGEFSIGSVCLQTWFILAQVLLLPLVLV